MILISVQTHDIRKNIYLYMIYPVKIINKKIIFSIYDFLFAYNNVVLQPS